MPIDSFRGIFSAWVKMNNSGNSQCLMHARNTAGEDNFSFYVDVDGYLFINLEKLGLPLLQLVSNIGAITSGSGWHHILSSWDTEPIGAPLAYLYIDDVSNIGSQSIGGQYPAEVGYDTIDKMGILGWVFIGAVDGFLGNFVPWKGCVGQFYFNTQEYLDFSITNNRRKFITSSKRYVDLGFDGALPTGTSPSYFFNGDKDAFPINQGTDFGFQNVLPFDNCLVGIPG